MKKRLSARLALFLALALLLLTLSGCQRQSTPAPIVSTPTPEPTTEPTAQPEQQVITAPAAPGAGGSVTVQNQTGQMVTSLTEDADLRIAMVAVNGSGFDPITCNARDISSLLKLVFESVVELDDSMQPTALLATGWSNEGNVYTFTLREGIRFHNGAALTAYDVYASYEAIQIAGSFSPYFARTQYIRAMTVIDEYTIQVEGQSCGYLTLYAMTFPVVSQISISSSAALPKGTGPYWFVASDANGNVRLERNPLWWKKQSNLQTIVGMRYDSDTEALTALETGQVDCVATRSASAALSRQLSDRSTMDYSTLTWECLVPNLSHSIVGDLAVRQAMMYAIDRSTLANTTYLGIVQESEVPVIPGSYLYEPQSTQYNYNPERALQILYDAGWQDTNGDGILDRIKDGLWEDLAFEIITYNEPGISIRTEALAAIAQQLNRIGFNVTVNTLSKSRVTSNMDRDTFALALVAYNLSEVPDLEFMLGSGESGNYSGYADETMDDLLLSARQAVDEQSFISAMSDVQMRVVSDLPVMGLFFRTGILVSNISLGGLSGIRESQVLRGIQYVAG